MIPQKCCLLIKQLTKLIAGHQPSPIMRHCGWKQQEEKKLIILTDLDINGWDKEVFSEIEPLPNIPLQIYNFSALSLKRNKMSLMLVVEIYQDLF